MNNTETKILYEFSGYIRNKCNNDKSVSCKIDDYKLNEITSFIAHEIPKCKKIDISLDDLKDSQVLAKGGFGYSYLTAMNNNSRKKIIKIAICTDPIVIENLKSDNKGNELSKFIIMLEEFKLL